ncbi:MAG TPA: hypothetical protein VNJ08_16455 [Bacteriovoracaceae bacterium]|nr:hypothetical protein [Bacteriovoracaceae bacterium]
MGRTFFSFITMVMLTLFASCGKQPQVLTGVQVQTSHVENDIWLSFSADLNLGAMSFPAITLPVLHPRTLIQVGQVELAPSLGGKNYLKLGVNLSELSDIRSSRGSLPNGNTIPLIANNPTVVVNLGSGAQLYITVSETVTALGVAIPIRQFDQIGQSVPGLNIFPVIAIDKVIATAGLFTSRNAGQNGIAVVADVSQYVNMQEVFKPQSGAAIMMAQAEEAMDAIKLDYRSHAPGKNAQDKVNRIIYDMNNRRLRLQLNR